MEKFQPSEYSGSFPVKVGSITTITITLYRSLQEVDERTICQGENTQKLSSNIIVLESCMVKITKERYVTKGSLVETLESHTKHVYSAGRC